MSINIDTEDFLEPQRTAASSRLVDCCGLFIANFKVFFWGGIYGVRKGFDPSFYMFRPQSCCTRRPSGGLSTEYRAVLQYFSHPFVDFSQPPFYFVGNQTPRMNCMTPKRSKNVRFCWFYPEFHVKKCGFCMVLLKNCGFCWFYPGFLPNIRTPWSKPTFQTGPNRFPLSQALASDAAPETYGVGVISRSTATRKAKNPFQNHPKKKRF